MRRCGERDEEMWGERLSKRWKKMEQKEMERSVERYIYIRDI